MRVVSQYRRPIHQFICASTPAAFLAAWVLLLAALGILAVMFFCMGAPAMNGRAWDTPLFLEGAWRLANGQVPHRDFYSYLGVLPFYVTWLGMKLSRPCVSAITYGNVFVMAALGASTLAVLRHRTSALYAVVMSLFLALLAVTPRPLGDPYIFTDYAMLYNRYGESFIGLFGVVLFIPPLPAARRPWADWADTAFTGTILTMLLFCKVNYFLLGLGFFVLACLLGRFSAGKALFCLLSAAVVLGVICLVTHIPAAAIWHDYRITAAAPDKLDRLRAMTVHGIENALYLPVLGLLVWEMASRQDERNPRPGVPWRHAIVIAAIGGGALLLLSTDTQEGELPLLALAGLYGAEMIRRDVSGTTEDSFLVTVRNLGALALFALLLVPTFATDCKTVIFCARDAVKSKWVSTETLQSTRLNDFRFTKGGTRFAEMRNYMEYLDEGIQLLRRHSNPPMRLSGWLFSNPYHFALGWVPAMGGMVGMSDTSVVKRSHPSLKSMMGNATHILMDEEGRARIEEAYGAEWDALHLGIVERTRNFTLLKVPETVEKVASEGELVSPYGQRKIER